MMWVSPYATETFVRPETRRRKSRMNKTSITSIGRWMKGGYWREVEKDNLTGTPWHQHVPQGTVNGRMGGKIR
jgi:hypothetical protein